MGQGGINGGMVQKDKETVKMASGPPRVSQMLYVPVITPPVFEGNGVLSVVISEITWSA